jgi:hypothetical protein
MLTKRLGDKHPLNATIKSPNHHDPDNERLIYLIFKSIVEEKDWSPRSIAV